jgi:hypothetical protein
MCVMAQRVRSELPFSARAMHGLSLESDDIIKTSPLDQSLDQGELSWRARHR